MILEHRTPETWIVVDLGFGDAGKGTITDFLVRSRKATLVVRFNGGAQAGHNVVLPSGTHHTFAQFGAGSLVPGVATHLSDRMVIHPGGMEVEAGVLNSKISDDVLGRTTIDARALVISPFQQAAGRLRELSRRGDAHGSCGIGFGEAVGDSLSESDDVIRARDLTCPSELLDKLHSQQRRKRLELAHLAEPGLSAARDELEVLMAQEAPQTIYGHWTRFARHLNIIGEQQAADLLCGHQRVVLEGAQGVLLDQDWGFHPNTTWSDCTPRGARALLRELGRDNHDTRCVGVIRSYSTRHGAGPLPTVDPSYASSLEEPHNDDRGWQGAFRRGPLDLVLLRYALRVAPSVDELAITCLDQAAELSVLKSCDRYRTSTTEVLADLFDFDANGQICALKPAMTPDLEHMDNLRRALGTVSPVLSTLGTGEGAVSRLVELVEAKLSRPVSLTSYGPTANDKRWVA